MRVASGNLNYRDFKTYSHSPKLSTFETLKQRHQEHEGSSLDLTLTPLWTLKRKAAHTSHYLSACLSHGISGFVFTSPRELQSGLFRFGFYCTICLEDPSKRVLLSKYRCSTWSHWYSWIFMCTFWQPLKQTLPDKRIFRNSLRFI